MKSLLKFLEHFYVITKHLSGAKYVTSNTYFEEVNKIQLLLNKWSLGQDNFLCNIATRMFSKFDKYLNISKLNIILIIAMVLDPQYKLS